MARSRARGIDSSRARAMAVVVAEVEAEAVLGENTCCVSIYFHHSHHAFIFSNCPRRIHISVFLEVTQAVYYAKYMSNCF